MIEVEIGEPRFTKEHKTQEPHPGENCREALRRVSGHTRTCPDRLSFQKAAQRLAFFQVEPCCAPPDCIQKCPTLSSGRALRFGLFGRMLRGSALLHPFWLQSGAGAAPDNFRRKCGSPISPPSARPTPIPLSSASLRNAPFKGGSAADFERGAPGAASL